MRVEALSLASFLFGTPSRRASGAQMHTVTPLAALTIGAIDKALCGDASVERCVKQALREGGKTGAVSSPSERAAVASAIFGTTVMRARLAWLLASTGLHGAQMGMPIPAASLLGIYLLHEEHYRVPRGALAAALPVTSLGLPDSALSQLCALDVSDLAWPAAPAVRLAVRHSLPVGLARAFLARLGEDQAAALCSVLNRPGPVVLRANVGVLGRVRAREQLIASLRASGIDASAGRHSPWSVVLDEGHDGQGRAAWSGSVWNLPQWSEGAFEVQDEGSQMVALACEVCPGERVLDLCAGNGGKTLALAPLLLSGDSGAKGVEEERSLIVAHDVNAERLRALQASATRARLPPHLLRTLVGTGGTGGDCSSEELLRLSACETGRASNTNVPEGFDVVLVDAPCSSSGALRRHPGLRWSGRWSSGGGVRPGQREEHGVCNADLQMALLKQAAGLVRPGGRLIYATCSLDVAENEMVADAFEAFARGPRSGFALEPGAALPFGSQQVELLEGDRGARGRSRDAAQHRCTLWPHLSGTDGFFIARWRVFHDAKGHEPSTTV
jgi:16S rRNA (cytosine967-C5)-methyltransferase